MLSVESLLSGLPIKDCPRILQTYLFCCPGLDGNLRCLPKAGGYYDQDYTDMVFFSLIEQRIAEHRKRKANRKEKT